MSAVTRTIALSFVAASLALTCAMPAGAKTKAKPSGVQLKRAPAFTYANGQSAAERERAEENRLRRECRGRPNSGACMGYTR